MMDAISLTIALGMFVGFVLAITGAGGAILSLPLLVFFLHLKMIDAAPISLMAIMLSAALAAGLGLRSGIVRYKAATLLATFGVLCAPIGVYVAHQLPEKALAILFSIVLLIVSWRSFQKFQTPTLLIGDDCEDPNGCEDAGFLSGLLGVGGGFIIVPTLHSISNLEAKMIVATSLAVIALVSMASAFSYAGNGTILWSIAVPFVSATVVGMGIGRMLHSKIPSHMSVLIFGILSLTIAILMLIKTAIGV